MKTQNNTILITGGGSGIGRGLAEYFQSNGNQVIIAGRDTNKLQGVVNANPGMDLHAVDMTNADSIQTLVNDVVKQYPKLNVLINMAGIMAIEDLKDRKGDFALVESVISTNLLGPIRLIDGLMPVLLGQAESTIINVTSGLGFLPLAQTPTYCATKAALHSYSESLRYQLQGTNIEILELIPPYVQTTLNGPGQAEDPRAMPLAEYLTEVIEILNMNPTPNEITVGRAMDLRMAGNFNPEAYAHLFKGFNDAMSGTIAV